MSPIIRISDLDAPELEPYRDQKDAWLRAGHNPSAIGSPTGTGMAGGLFMAEGLLVFEQLIRSPHRVASVLVSESRLAAIRPLLATLPEHTPVYVGEPDLLEGIVGFRMHRGILACAEALPPPRFEAILERARTLVVLEDLANHDNVGGIFRSVRALAGPNAAVLLTKRCCDPLYRRALRVSIGHALHVPWTWLDDWPGAIDAIQRAGHRVLALTPSEHSTPLRSLSRPAGGRICLLAGAEGPGLTEQALARADTRVRIETDSAVDSLNVAVAVAVSLHALRHDVGD